MDPTEPASVSGSAPPPLDTALTDAFPSEAALTDSPLRPTMDDITAICSKCRILVVGRSGCGKSSLINSIFRIKGDLAKVSDDKPGEADIEREFTYEDNPYFVTHDSRGFEAGEEDNLKTIKHFVKNRKKAERGGDRIHAIWLCIQIPHANSRLERGDEEILKMKARSVPIIIVFTKYDKSLAFVRAEVLEQNEVLQQNHDLDSAVVSDIAQPRVEAEFEEKCVKSMRAKGHTRCLYVSTEPGYEATLKNLVKLTAEAISSPTPTFTSRFSFLSRAHRVNVQTEQQDAARIAFTAAQQVAIDPKVRASIAVGRKKYWRRLASSAYFADKPLKECTKVIHTDIVEIWNFGDLRDHLISHGFRARMTRLENDLADPETTDSNDGLVKWAKGAISAVGATASTAPHALPVVIPVAAVTLFAKWVWGGYKKTPGILRCLMAYIVDLTLIMQRIAHCRAKILNTEGANSVDRHDEAEGSDAANRPMDRVLTPGGAAIAERRAKATSAETADAAFAKYDESEQKTRIHERIRQFVEDVGFPGIPGKDSAIDEVERLIVSNTPGFD